MKIIGLNAGVDAANETIYSGGVAYINDGIIEIAMAEDRVSRNKDDGGFEKSLAYIYKEFGITEKDVDYFCISFYGHPIFPHTDMINKYLKVLKIETVPEKLVVMPSHHYSHAYLAHMLSGFEESIIMVADNEGNLMTPKEAEEKVVMFNHCERNSYYWAKGNCMTLIDRDFSDFGDVSFGKMYNKFNEYIGFDSYLCVGKTMGLSSYGQIPKEWKDLDLWYMDSSGHLHSNLKETHDSYDDIEYYFKRNGIELRRNLDYNSELYRNLAFFVQEQLNKWAMKKVQFLTNKYGIYNICISGGVGLNSIMNYKIGKELGVEVFVPPYCSDPGQALGNAIYGYISKMSKNANALIEKIKFDEYIYLGKEYTNEVISGEISTFMDDERITINKMDDITECASDLIVNGYIIGWFQGRSEYGARALGNRSILALPTSCEIRDRINTLKRRELFRPLAPAVIDYLRDEYFEDVNKSLDEMMLRVVPVKCEKREIIEGVTHVDGTARLQVVTKKNNHIFYELIEKVYLKNGIPIVVNTSFNAAGNPIVESVKDAIEEFLLMELDYLVCGEYLIEKRKVTYECN